MVYKTLKKVSNVCQVLDKSKYPATGTGNGITFTHNGDGSYTANGTFASSDGSYFYFCDGANKNTVKLVANHKYLVLNGAYYEAGTYPVWMVVNNQLVAESNGTIFGNDYNSKCYTPNKNEEADLSMRIVHKTNVDTINFTFKPQLFDLTEMYGAGHEPKSVEQFRQDFPDEMYDYSPHCWLTSYKRVFLTGNGNYLTSYQRNLTCKTKNLWTCNKNSTFYTYDKSTQVFTIFSTGLASCYTLPTPINAGETFTISVYCLSGELAVPGMNVTIGGYHFGEKNSWQTAVSLPLGNVGGKVYYNTATTTDTLTDFFIFVYQSVPTNLKVRIQFERGSTATDYVPYGHL